MLIIYWRQTKKTYNTYNETTYGNGITKHNGNPKHAQVCHSTNGVPRTERYKITTVVTKPLMNVEQVKFMLNFLKTYYKVTDENKEILRQLMIDEDIRNYAGDPQIQTLIYKQVMLLVMTAIFQITVKKPAIGLKPAT